jgi:hypothetical protein
VLQVLLLLLQVLLRLLLLQVLMIRASLPLSCMPRG